MPMAPGVLPLPTCLTPEALSTIQRIAEMPDIAGLLKAREIEEGERPPHPTQLPQEQRKMDEPTATLVTLRLDHVTIGHISTDRQFQTILTREGKPEVPNKGLNKTEATAFATTD
ncbi:hypothetical protein NDU88_003730 [Pleurodeles waltl]|uniref:Uncharacterized protein n=1 Tax=Pleurodeles waltl TaxID=8319 RepID=A0AAV7UEH9_PLEWA|nr:hypothetical protein NDU88_003730 [Pleurodeles waltl]